MRTLLGLAAALALSVLSIGSARADILYAAEGALGLASAANPTRLWIVNTATAQLSLVGNLQDAQGNWYAINGIEYDYATGIMYGETHHTSPTAPGSLVTINLANAQVSVVGSHGLTGQGSADLSLMDDRGAKPMYGWIEPQASALATINLATGAATIVGPNGQNLNTTGSGLAANAAGVMYSTPNGSQGSIWQVNKATGQLLAPVGLSNGLPNGRIGSLDFDPATGILYGNELVGDLTSGITQNRLITINPVTGVITNIGQFTQVGTGAFISRIDAIAFVPEPSSMVLVGCGLVGVITLAYRRRKAQA
jgi:hypothetical protein